MAGRTAYQSALDRSLDAVAGKVRATLADARRETERDFGSHRSASTWRTENIYFRLPPPDRTDRRKLVAALTGAPVPSPETLFDKQLLAPGGLTNEGLVQAICSLSLARQCRLLSVPLEEWDTDVAAHPELAMCKRLAIHGHHVVWSQGEVMRLVLFFAGDRVLWPAVRSAFKRDADAGDWYRMLPLGYLLQVADQFVEAVFSASEADIRTGYRRVRSFQDWACSRFMKDETLFDEDRAVAFYYGLSKQVWQRLARTFLSDPMAFSHGWPDIELVKKGRYLGVEVKTSDRLSRSQVITMGALLPLGIDFRVGVARPCTGSAG